MKVSVVISTYNAPNWLEKVLWGYACQDYKNFEIVIADDGSKPETKELIDRLAQDTGLDIKHMWHEDQGYRRQTILNVAILQCTTDYIIFTDGDCIPRNDFVRIHVEKAEKGFFLSGGYCKLPIELSNAIEKPDIYQQVCFDASWLKKKGSLGFSQRRKLTAKGVMAKFYDAVTPAKATFNNCNSSGWKEDILFVKGYDERMQYGGADREIGERLVNAGIKGKQIRHQAICLHLHHERGYAKRESIEKNLKIRKHTKDQNIKQTEFGIK